MPIYELVCQKCGQEENLLGSWKNRQEAVCSVCGSENLTQKFTSIGIIGSKSGSANSSASPSRQSGFT